MSTNDLYIKPLVGAASVLAIEKFILKEQNMNRSLYFAGTVGAALYLSNTVLNPMFGGVFKNGKGYLDRGIEIGSASLGSYAVNKYVLNNSDYSNNEMIKKVGVVVAADIIGEYASDYMNNRALSYFS